MKKIIALTLGCSLVAGFLVGCAGNRKSGVDNSTSAKSNNSKRSNKGNKDNSGNNNDGGCPGGVCPIKKK